MFLFYFHTQSHILIEIEKEIEIPVHLEDYRQKPELQNLNNGKHSGL
jgi:hypothetical protein